MFKCWYESADFFKCRHNDGTMKPIPHTVFNISITCATQKRRGLPNTELHICTIHFFFNNIRDNRPFCCRRWWFPVNCVRTILNQKVKTLKFYTKVHLRVNECKTFTGQNRFQFLVFSFFFQWCRHNGFQLEQKAMGHSEATRGGVLWALARRAGDRL